MLRYLIARLGQGLLVVLLVITVTFVLLHAAPGDPMTRLRGRGDASPEVIAQIRRHYALDQPLWVQYRTYVGRLARGDLGISTGQRRPVFDAIRERLPNTLLLAVAALAIDFGLGITVGMVQGRRAGTRVDRALSVATITFYSMPVFWLGLMFQLVLARHLGWFPVAGVADAVATQDRGLIAGLADRLHHLVLPACTLGLAGFGYTARHQRSAMLDAMGQDFVRTARAKGLRERLVILRHALRNALLPTITLIGLSIPVLLSGAVLVEFVFAWPGMGQLAADAINARDYPLVTGTAMLAAVLVVIGNIAADLAVRAADPRTRTAG